MKFASSNRLSSFNSVYALEKNQVILLFRIQPFSAFLLKMREEIKNHLINGIIPFWKGMRDDEFGGYYGFLDYDLNLDKKAEKGRI